MRLDFEKFLNENGLKVGDRVKLATGDIYEIIRHDDYILYLRDLNTESIVDIQDLRCYFEKVESKKKVGEMTCNVYNEKYGCENCIFFKVGLDCGSYREDVAFNVLKEGFLKDHPLLEPLRPVIEKELDKEENI